MGLALEPLSFSLFHLCLLAQLFFPCVTTEEPKRKKAGGHSGHLFLLIDRIFSPFSWSHGNKNKRWRHWPRPQGKSAVDSLYWVNLLPPPDSTMSMSTRLGRLPSTFAPILLGRILPRVHSPLASPTVQTHFAQSVTPEGVAIVRVPYQRFNEFFNRVSQRPGKTSLNTCVFWQRTRVCCLHLLILLQFANSRGRYRGTGCVVLGLPCSVVFQRWFNVACKLSCLFPMAAILFHV